MGARPLGEAQPSMAYQMVVRASDERVILVHGHLGVNHVRHKIPPTVYRVIQSKFAVVRFAGPENHRCDSVTKEVFLHNWHEIVDVYFAVELYADFVDFG